MPGAPSALHPYPLNRDGEGHAREAAAIVDGAMVTNDWHLDPEIDCSQLLRAWQTARIIADILAGKSDMKPELESFDDLAERSVGCVANLTTEQIRTIVHDDPRYPELPDDWKSNSKFCLPLQGAESLLDAGERVASHIVGRMSALQAKAGDTLKLFVGHGAAFRHAAFHLGILEYQQIASLSMYHGRPVFLQYLDDGSWCHIEGDWKVRAEHSEYKD